MSSPDGDVIKKQLLDLVRTPGRTPRLTTPKSKIYFSTAMSKASQPARMDKTGPSAVPCGTPVNIDHEVIGSQHCSNSESSGSSSSQSTTSVSLLSSSRAKLIAGRTQEKRRIEVLVEEDERNEPSVEYTGFVFSD